MQSRLPSTLLSQARHWAVDAFFLMSSTGACSAPQAGRKCLKRSLEMPVPISSYSKAPFSPGPKKCCCHMLRSDVRSNSEQQVGVSLSLFFRSSKASWALSNDKVGYFYRQCVASRLMKWRCWANLQADSIFLRDWILGNQEKPKF